MARSTLIGIMGQISCYTGKEVTWEQVSASDFYFAAQARGRARGHGAAGEARRRGHLPGGVRRECRSSYETAGGDDSGGRCASRRSPICAME